MTRTVLLLGSGFVAKPVLFYFKRFPNYHVLIATNDQKTGEKLHKAYSEMSSLFVFDVTKRENILPLIKKSDVVISLLPYSLHPTIARFCIDASKHLVTSSYISPELEKLNQECQSRNLIILNEMGLDPGIDHIATMKIKDDIEQRGGKIVGFRSFCGALTSPECLDNPLAYKFTWSPAGVINAISDAQYLENGKVVRIPREDLLYNIGSLKTSNALNLLYYPNRDSVKYKKTYGFEHTQSLIRGTVRFPGFIETLTALFELGLTKKETPIAKTWFETVRPLIASQSPAAPLFTPADLENARRWLGLASGQIQPGQLLNAISTNHHWAKMTPVQRSERARRAIEGLAFLGLFNPNLAIADPKTTLFDNLVALMSSKMLFKRSDRDLVVLTLEFDVEFDTGARELTEFKLIMTGDSDDLTAVEKGVGMTAAVAAKLIIDGKVQKRGVIGPFSPDVYNPAFKELTELGLIVEAVTHSFPPKL